MLIPLHDYTASIDEADCLFVGVDLTSRLLAFRAIP